GINEEELKNLRIHYDGKWVDEDDREVDGIWSISDYVGDDTGYLNAFAELLIDTSLSNLINEFVCKQHENQLAVAVSAKVIDNTIDLENSLIKDDSVAIEEQLGEDLTVEPKKRNIYSPQVQQTPPQDQLNTPPPPPSPEHVLSPPLPPQVPQHVPPPIQDFNLDYNVGNIADELETLVVGPIDFYHSENENSDVDDFTCELEFNAFEEETQQIFDEYEGEEEVGYKCDDLPDPEHGMSWPTIDDARDYVRTLAIFRKFEFKYKYNDGNRFEAICTGFNMELTLTTMAPQSQRKSAGVGRGLTRHLTSYPSSKARLTICRPRVPVAPTTNILVGLTGVPGAILVAMVVWAEHVITEGVYDLPDT
ncbi:hypothetical protein FRX31_018402, partial [Thalictrum thalictroides]